MVGGLAAGHVHAVDGNLPRVQFGHALDGSLGELAIGQKEHGIGLESNGLGHGGPRVGAAVGADQVKPGCELVLGLQVGRAWQGPSRHRRGLFVVEDDLESLRRLKGEDAPEKLDLGRVRRSSSIMLPDWSTTKTKNWPRARSPKNEVCRQVGISLQSVPSRL